MKFVSAAAILLLVTSTDASTSSCDASQADNLIAHLNQFNSLLVNYANLGSSIKTTIKHIQDVEDDDPEKLNANQQHHSHNIFAFVKPAMPQAQLQSQDPLKHFQPQAQMSYNALSVELSKLDSLSSICIPASHKIQIAAAVSKMLSTFTSEFDNLKTVGKLVQQPAPMKKGRKDWRNAEKRYAVQPGWMTMDDAMNQGYNGHPDAATLRTSAPMAPPASSAPPVSPVQPIQPMQSIQPMQQPHGQPAPRYKAQYITITTTQEAQGQPTDTTDDDSSHISGSDSSDDDSDSDDDGGDSATAQPTKKPGFFASAFDGTIHLVTSTIRFAENIFHIGRKKSTATAAPMPDADGNDDDSDSDSSEIAKLVKSVAVLYSVQL